MLRCTHCNREYTREAYDELKLAKTNGGRVTYGSETHEYRICACGCHVLLVTRRSERPVSRPPSQPSFVPMFAEAYDARRR